MQNSQNQNRPDNAREELVSRLGGNKPPATGGVPSSGPVLSASAPAAPSVQAESKTQAPSGDTKVTPSGKTEEEMVLVLVKETQRVTVGMDFRNQLLTKDEKIRLPRSKATPLIESKAVVELAP